MSTEKGLFLKLYKVRSSSIIDCSMPFFKAPKSPVGKRIPYFPFSRISLGPKSQSEDTILSFNAIASIKTAGRPSY